MTNDESLKRHLTALESPIAAENERLKRDTVNLLEGAAGRIARLEIALRGTVDNFKPFTLKPIGAPGSLARAEQDAQIAAHAAAVAALGDDRWKGGRYSDDEIASLQRQKRNGNRAAKAVITGRAPRRPQSMSDAERDIEALIRRFAFGTTDPRTKDVRLSQAERLTILAALRTAQEVERLG